MRDRDEPRGRVSYTWDGRDEAGRIVPEARYRPRVRIEEHGRTIVLPNPIRVDTTPPRIRFTDVFPRVFSPDGDGQRDRVTATYEVDESRAGDDARGRAAPRARALPPARGHVSPGSGR